MIRNRSIVVIVLLFGMFSTAHAYGNDIKMLFFYEDGCKYCEKMDKVLEDASIHNIVSQNTSMIKVKITGKKHVDDGKTEEELAREYNIKGVPTIVFLSPGGKELFRVPGLLSKEDFKDILCHYVKGIKRGCKD